jgi:hypothetical protein
MFDPDGVRRVLAEIGAIADAEERRSIDQLRDQSRPESERIQPIFDRDFGQGRMRVAVDGRDEDRVGVTVQRSDPTERSLTNRRPQAGFRQEGANLGARERVGLGVHEAVESGELVGSGSAVPLAVRKVDHDRLQRSLRAAMDPDDASGTRCRMTDTRRPAVFEEDLTALHGLSFLDLHARLQSGEVVRQHGDALTAGGSSDDLDRPTGEREIEALFEFVMRHARPPSSSPRGDGDSLFVS